MTAAAVSAQTPARPQRISGAAFTLPQGIEIDRTFVPAGSLGDGVNVMVELVNPPAIAAYTTALTQQRFSPVIGPVQQLHLAFARHLSFLA